MRRFETLDSITTPDGRRLTLHHRDGDFFIYLDGDELMSSRAPGSESALAEIACRELPAVQRPRVLIGGLGLGYTLRSALAALPAGARVEVAEIFAGVVEWNRTHLAGLGRPLEDPRVRVVERDVLAVIREARHRFHAILLDVDNGPSAWCLDANSGLYDRRGLELIRAALAPDGLLAVWSAHPDPAFVKLLRKSGWDARCETARARGEKGARHALFLARIARRKD